MKKTIDKNSDEYILLEKALDDKKAITFLFNEFKKIEDKFGKELTMGEAFEVYVASMLTGKSYSLAIEDNTLLKENSDGGIDVFVFNKDTETLTLVQTKLENYDPKYIYKMMNTWANFIKKYDEQLNNNNKSVQKIRELYKSNNINNIEYIFVGIDEVDEESVQQSFQNKNIKIFSIKTFINNAGDDLFRDNYSEKVSITFQKTLNNPGQDMPKDQDNWFIHVDGKDLMNEFAKFNDFAIDSLFEENIRNRVVKNKFVNEFKETIKNTPELFHFFNNGLTMVCQDVNPAGAKIELIKPQIINGQQTIRTLLEIHNLNDNEYDLSKISIPIKIIKISDKEIIKKIARYSNNQTAVKLSELNFIDKEYIELKALAKTKGYLLKGKKGGTFKDNILKLTMSKGELELKEIVRSHAACYYPEKYLGDSKNKIASVIDDYFEDKKYINQVLKVKTFDKLVEIIRNYEDYYSNKIKIASHINIVNNGSNKTIADKKAKDDNKHLKFGTSVFYNLTNREFDNKYIDNIIKYITCELSDSTINIFKNNNGINKTLEQALNENSK